MQRSRRPARRAARTRAGGAWPRIARTLAASALGLGLVVAGTLAWLLVVYARAPSAEGTTELLVDLDQTRDPDALADALAGAGLVSHPRAFALYLRVMGADSKLRHGRILITAGRTPKQLVQRLAIGFGPGHVRVVIPEGFNRFDVAARLARFRVCEEDAFLRATTDTALLRSLGVQAASAEGYLFPDTYELATDLAAPDAVRLFVANFRRRVMPVIEQHAQGLADLQRTLHFGLHEALTLASVVEKEAVAPAEQPVIAGVFLNRLRDPAFTPHRLQADPTVSYGCFAARAQIPSCVAFDGHRVTRAMTNDAANRYNTYRVDGIPPGPISNPGLGAIRAVLAPTRHDYLYFVARGSGRHTFSATLAEHDEAVRAWRAQQSHTETP